MILSTASDLNSMTTTLSSPEFRLSIIVCPRVLKLSNERVTVLAAPFPVLLKVISTLYVVIVVLERQPLSEYVGSVVHVFRSDWIVVMRVGILRLFRMSARY